MSEQGVDPHTQRQWLAAFPWKEAIEGGHWNKIKPNYLSDSDLDAMFARIEDELPLTEQGYGLSVFVARMATSQASTEREFRLAELYRAVCAEKIKRNETPEYDDPVRPFVDNAIAVAKELGFRPAEHDGAYKNRKTDELQFLRHSQTAAMAAKVQEFLDADDYTGLNEWLQVHPWRTALTIKELHENFLMKQSPLWLCLQILESAKTCEALMSCISENRRFSERATNGKLLTSIAGSMGAYHHELLFRIAHEDDAIAGIELQKSKAELPSLGTNTASEKAAARKLLLWQLVFEDDERSAEFFSRDKAADRARVLQQTAQLYDTEHDKKVFSRKNGKLRELAYYAAILSEWRGTGAILAESKRRISGNQLES